MSKILELREKRAKAWEAAKAFLDTKRGNDGLLSAEDTETKMEKDVVDLGKEIERLERQAATGGGQETHAELNKPTSTPITNKPNGNPDGFTLFPIAQTSISYRTLYSRSDSIHTSLLA